VYNGNHPLPSPKSMTFSPLPIRAAHRSPLCGGLQVRRAQQRPWWEAGEGGRQLRLRGKALATHHAATVGLDTECQLPRAVVILLEAVPWGEV
jgi:hypothetical protein